MPWPTIALHLRTTNAQVNPFSIPVRVSCAGWPDSPGSTSWSYLTIRAFENEMASSDDICNPRFDIGNKKNNRPKNVRFTNCSPMCLPVNCGRQHTLQSPCAVKISLSVTVRLCLTPHGDVRWIERCPPRLPHLLPLSASPVNKCVNARQTKSWLFMLFFSL